MVNRRNVLICFACAAFALAGWGVAMYDVLFRQATLLFTLSSALALPFACVTIFMAVNSRTFPFPYNVFGTCPRTPFPAASAVKTFPNSWGGIGKGRFTVPFINWFVFASGLGIEIGGFGRVFLPYQSISSVETMSFGRYNKLFHSHPEVRSPVVVPQNVFEAMRSSLTAEKTPQ
jgi:hypothetical protein